MAHEHEMLVTGGTSGDMTDGTNLSTISESTTAEFFTATAATPSESTTTQFFTATEASCSNTEDSTPPGPAPSSVSEYYSPRIQRMIELMKTSGMNKVEAEIEASKDHWTSTELPSTMSESTSESVLVEEDEAEVQAIMESNLQLFEILRKGPPCHISWREYDSAVVGEMLAEGGQAEIFLEEGTVDGVLKVFKRGTPLQDLLKQIPPALLHRISLGLQSPPIGFTGRFLCLNLHIWNEMGAVVLKDGRFAFAMTRYSNDLRKFIDDIKMRDNRNQGLPFPHAIATLCMLQIAFRMQELDDENIIHRDLKASNVLININKWGGFGPVVQDKYPFYYCVADFECSLAVYGMAFWRAPEILFGVKNCDVKPELFNEKSDVYSYAMTCYKILRGLIPLECERYSLNNYDVVIRGERPKLPSDIKPWIKELLRRCWHQEPSQRPTFEEIGNIIQNMEPSIINVYIELIVYNDEYCS